MCGTVVTLVGYSGDDRIGLEALDKPSNFGDAEDSDDNEGGSEARNDGSGGKMISVLVTGLRTWGLGARGQCRYELDVRNKSVGQTWGGCIQ